MKAKIIEIYNKNFANAGTYSASVSFRLPKKAAKYFAAEEAAIKYKVIQVNDVTVGHVEREDDVLFVVWDESLPFNIKQSLTAALKNAAGRGNIKPADDDGVAGEEDEKGTDEVADTSSDPQDGDLHGGDNASNEVEDSPNAAENGEEDKDLHQESGDNNAISEDNNEGTDGDNEINNDNATSADGDNSTSGDNNTENGSEASGNSEANTANSNDGGDATTIDAGVDANNSVGQAAASIPTRRELEAAAKAVIRRLILESDSQEKIVEQLVKETVEAIENINEYMKKEDSFDRLINRDKLEIKASKDLQDLLIFDDGDELLKEMLEKLKIELPEEVVRESERQDRNAAYAQSLSTSKFWYRNISELEINKKYLRRAKKIFDKILSNLGGDEESPRLDVRRLIKNIETYKSPYNAYKKEIGVDNFMLVVDTSESMSGFTPLAAFAIKLAKADERLVVVLTTNNWPYAIIKNKEEDFFPANHDAIAVWKEILSGVKPSMGLNINDLDGLDVWEEVLDLTKNTKWVLANNYRCSELARPVLIKGGDSKMPTWKNCKHYVGVGDIENVLDIIEYNFANNRWRSKVK